MFKFNKKDTRTTSLVFSRRSSVFIVNFERILHFFSSVSIAGFEEVNICWVNPLDTSSKSIMFIIN